MGTAESIRGIRAAWIRTAVMLVVAAGVAAAQGRDWMRAGTSLLAHDGTNWVVQATGFQPGSWGIAVDGTGSTWSTNYVPGMNTITHADPTGQIIGTYVCGPVAPVNDSTAGPVAVNRDNLVFVGDPSQNGNRITVLDFSGVVQYFFTVPGSSIRNLSFDSNGDLWVQTYYSPSATGDLIFKVDILGNLLASATPINIGTPNHVRADEWGRVVVTHNPSSYHLRILRTNGTTASTPVIPWSYGTLRVTGSGLDGSILVGSSSGYHLVSPTGTVTISSALGGLPMSIETNHTGQFRLSMRTNGGAPALVHITAAGAQTGIVSIPSVSQPTAYCFNFGDFTGMHRIRVIDRDGDFDQDGFSNRDELMLGSDPRNFLSVPTAAEFAYLAQPQIGTQCQIRIHSSRDPGAPYAMPFTLNPNWFPVSALEPGDPRWMEASPLDLFNPTQFDPVFLMSMNLAWPGGLVFPTSIGTLNSQGEATVHINIPNDPILVGLTIRGFFVTFVNGMPANLRTISRSLPVTFF